MSEQKATVSESGQLIKECRYMCLSLNERRQGMENWALDYPHCLAVLLTNCVISLLQLLPK